MQTDMNVDVTFEGDNTVMMQQVGAQGPELSVKGASQSALNSPTCHLI